MFKLCFLVVAALALGPQAVKGIVGGHDAGNDEFPYHVFLEENGVYYCNGALISSNHVLTATVCTRHPEASVYAVVGSVHPYHNIGHRYRVVGSEIASSPSAQVHVSNSISVLKLERNVHRRRSVSLAVQYRGLAATVTAAGARTYGGPYSDVLQSLQVQLDPAHCNLRSNIYNYHPAQICIDVEHGEGLCSGDEGGPLVQNGAIIGVAIRSSEHCGMGFPDTYTSILPFRDDIISIMRRT